MAALSPLCAAANPRSNHSVPIASNRLLSSIRFTAFSRPIDVPCRSCGSDPAEMLSPCQVGQSESHQERGAAEDHGLLAFRLRSNIRMFAKADWKCLQDS